MKQFKKLLQVAKSHGVYCMNASFGEEQAYKYLVDAAQRNEVFVFYPKSKKIPKDLKIKKSDDPLDKFIKSFQQHKLNQPTEVPEDEREISPPFEVFSIEYKDGHAITVPRYDDPVQVYIDCIMCEEIPNTYEQYRFYCLSRLNDTYMVCVTDDKNAYYQLVALSLERLNKEECGVGIVEKENVSFKNPKNKKKKINITKSRIYIVCDKPTRKNLDAQPKKHTYNWSATRSVRGHWRHYRCLKCAHTEPKYHNGKGCAECNYTTLRTSYTGKDRQGKPVVGKLWMPHRVDNQESDVLKKKIRVVK